MIGMRLRLTDAERTYILRLIDANTNLQEGMKSKAIVKLQEKLLGENKT